MTNHPYEDCPSTSVFPNTRPCWIKKSILASSRKSQPMENLCQYLDEISCIQRVKGFTLIDRSVTGGLDK